MFAVQHDNTRGLGLRNIGNSCFLNAVLQSLTSLKSFRNYLKERSVTIPVKSSLTKALNDTILKLHERRADMPFVPDVTKIDAVRERFLNKEQHDAHELMQYLLNHLLEESVTSVKSGISLLVSSSSTANHPNKFPFIGFLKNTMQCEHCKRMSAPTYQQFMDLSLSIPEAKTHVTLEDCLKYFTTSETVFDVDCANWIEPNSTAFDPQSNKKCFHPGGSSRALKKLTVARAPESLCLHIRRLVGTEGGFMKLNCHISFPVILDLSPFCSFDCSIPTEKCFDKSTARVSKLSSFASTSSSCAPTYNTSFSNKRFQGGSLFGSLNLSSCVGGDNASYMQHSKTDYELNKPDLDNPPKRLQNSTLDNGASLQYELVSVVEHHGSHSGGHYTVFRKDSNRMGTQWYHISDEVAKPVTMEEVTRSQAYMLYYERVSSTQ